MLLLSGSGIAATVSVVGGVVDLTGTGDEWTATNSLFRQTSVNGFGSGVATDFLTFDVTGINTTDKKYVGTLTGTANKNFSLQKSNLMSFNMSGVTYRGFALDVAEPGAASKISLLLNTVKIYTAGAGDLTGAQLDASGTLIFDMDVAAGEDVSIKLEGTGSGSSDMFMFIADSLFNGSANPYIYLYTEVSDHDGGSSEAWAFLGGGTLAPVPIPAAVWLFGSGLVGLFSYSKRKKLAS